MNKRLEKHLWGNKVLYIYLLSVIISVIVLVSVLR